MRGFLRRTGPSMTMDALWVLRTRAYGKELAAFLSLLGDVIDAADVPRMLSYLVRRGHVRTVGDGDAVRYVLDESPGADDIVGMKRERSLAKWPGDWHVLTYDIPATHNTDRRRLVRLLHRMGWAFLAGSSWVSPYDWSDVLKKTLANTDRRGRLYCMRCTDVFSPVESDEQDLAERWDLKDVHARYKQLLRTCSKAPRGSGYSARQGRVAAVMGMRRQLRLVEQMDPMLPRELLPPDWPRDELMRELERLRAHVESESHTL
jgi:phenylacetic acid degradation operon negative regulatory protein